METMNDVILSTLIYFWKLNNASHHATIILWAVMISLVGTWTPINCITPSKALTDKPLTDTPLRYIPNIQASQMHPSDTSLTYNPH